MVSMDGNIRQLAALFKVLAGGVGWGSIFHRNFGLLGIPSQTGWLSEWMACLQLSNVIVHV